MGNEDELIQAAMDGNEESMTKFIRRKIFGPEDAKSVRALACAAEKNQIKCMILLFEWGVDISGKVGLGNTPLHWACRANKVEAVEFLLEKKADYRIANEEGQTPMTIACKQTPPRFNAVRALLRGGMKAGPMDSVPGLTAVVREVQMESTMVRLRHMATVESNADAIKEADTKVWERQREHMELLKAKELHEVGVGLVELEKKHVEELAAARRTEEREELLGNNLKEQRVLLQSATSELAQLLRDLDENSCIEAHHQKDVDEVSASLAHEKGELSAALKARDDSDKARKAAEDARDKAIANKELWENEILAQRRYNEEVQSELAYAQKDYTRHMADKKTAQALTEQAHRMLMGDGGDGGDDEEDEDDGD